jgi:hypothetical protein
MKNRVVRTSILAAVALGVALTQQACDANIKVSQPEAGGPASVGITVDETPAASPTSTATSSGSKSSGKSTEGATTKKTESKVPGCTSDKVGVDITLQPSDGGSVQRGLVALTNTSSSTCAVEGRASISLANAAGETVDVPTREVDEPGPADRIVLKPGRTAFQGIKWTTCDKGSDTCPAGSSLRYNLEASTDGPYAKLIGFPNPEKSAITMKSLQVGTLQPVNQGVVAW